MHGAHLRLGLSSDLFMLRSNLRYAKSALLNGLKVLSLMVSLTVGVASSIIIINTLQHRSIDGLPAIMLIFGRLQLFL